MLPERREVLDGVETITAYAQDMRDFLLKSDLTKSQAVIRYSIPMPDDSRILGKDTEEVALAGSVLPTVPYAGPSVTELQTFEWIVSLRY